MSTQPLALTPEQVKRYSRHIIMGDVGSKGQRTLMQSSALIIGAGGLGSPSAIYLSLAGVGTIGIVDLDVVDLSNLQRQVLHHTADVGRPKVQSALDNIKSYNPDVNVVLHETWLNSENAMEIISQYDLVVNGADNFATRYLVNDACYLLGKPLVDGSILTFDGQATVFIPGEGCYRCLFPSPPPPGMVPNCAEAGVLGSMTGLIGSIQATEALKYFLGIGQFAVIPAADRRRLGHEFPRGASQAEPQVPAVRRQPHSHRTDRLRGLLPASLRLMRNRPLLARLTTTSQCGTSVHLQSGQRDYPRHRGPGLSPPPGWR